MFAVGMSVFKMLHNVGSYTQRRTAGDFLSDRTRKSSGEPPTEHHQTPHLPGSWCCSLVVLFFFFFPFLSRVGDASPLQSQSNGQVRSVKAQKCRIEYCLFPLLPISVYILKTWFRVKWQKSVCQKCPIEFRVELQKSVKKRNSVNPRNPKNLFKKSLKKTQPCRNRNPFQKAKIQHFVKLKQRFHARLQLATT